MDKAKLLSQIRKTKVVDLGDVGKVTVRGLSREEVMQIRQDLGESVDLGLFESRMLAAGMVDPEMTEAEVKEWRSVGDAVQVGLVVDAVAKLSGLEVGAEKAAYKSPRVRR